MSKIAQWYQVFIGASGSLQIKAKLLVCGGAPDQDSGGDRSSPSQV